MISTSLGKSRSISWKIWQLCRSHWSFRRIFSEDVCIFLFFTSLEVSGFVWEGEFGKVDRNVNFWRQYFRIFCIEALALSFNWISFSFFSQWTVERTKLWKNVVFLKWLLIFFRLFFNCFNSTSHALDVSDQHLVFGLKSKYFFQMFPVSNWIVSFLYFGLIFQNLLLYLLLSQFSIICVDLFEFILS